VPETHRGRHRLRRDAQRIRAGLNAQDRLFVQEILRLPVVKGIRAGCKGSRHSAGWPAAKLRVAQMSAEPGSVLMTNKIRFCECFVKCADRIFPGRSRPGDARSRDLVTFVSTYRPSLRPSGSSLARRSGRALAAMAGAPREKVKNNPMQGRTVKIHAAS